MQSFKKFLVEKNSQILDVLFEAKFTLPSKTILRETPDKHISAIQNWKDIPKNLSQEEKEKLAVKIYDEALFQAKTLQDNLFTILRKSSQNARKAKILVAIKSYPSFVDKVLKRGKQANKIHDVLRSAILCNTKEEVQNVSKWLRKNTRVHEFEEKEYGGDKEFGYYGSHHFKIFVKKEDIGMIAEIQVMTKALWQYKDKAHDIYNNYRSLSDAEKQASDAYKKDAAKSRQIFRQANR